MMKTYHPHPDEHGKPVVLKSPSRPTTLDTWSDAQAVATVTPGGPMPSVLNGAPLGSWSAPHTWEGWASVAGQLEFDEPAFACPPGKKEAAGVVIVEPDGRVWVVAPSNGYAGYTVTFPKGRVEKGLPRQANAIREAYEEAGLKVEITGFLADSSRSMTYTRYYLAKRVDGTPADMGWESQAVHLVPVEKLNGMLNHPNDMHLIEAIRAAVKRETSKSSEYHWTNDSYWTEALDRYIKLREVGTRELAIDLDRVETVIFNGDGPAYKTMDAMVSVREREGYEGFKDAPRIVCALLELLAHPRGSQTERPE
ncbi:NUDIX hydrolase [Paraburkholderia agricolaris]|uniref:NUDIX hydrolase n=1 Tax=Paraburkholderia agricolaris TaxID=2152888 RepID=UPI001FE33171|nr:NUDIX hydrolase [Paraburkholderia agricolaris]